MLYAWVDFYEFVSSFLVCVHGRALPTGGPSEQRISWAAIIHVFGGGAALLSPCSCHDEQ